VRPRGILSFYPQEKVCKPVQEVVEESVDSSRPRANFDGVTQGTLGTCGVGGVLYLKEAWCLRFKARICEGSNNYVEVMSLKLLLFKCFEICETSFGG
jgi:hypothetical protein